MTEQDEIIELARQVGAVPIGFNKTTMQKEYSIFFNELEAFAKLVEAKERKRIANKIDRMPFGDTAASFAVWIREGAP